METEAKSPEGEHVLIGTVLGERYRVDRFLGAGGMGEVYLAEHVMMKKPVALKVLHRELTRLDEVVQRFEREAIAGGRIDHPNVAAASDFGRLEDGSFYLVLEYVDGRSLRELVEEGPLELGRALSIGEQVAGALGAAHAAGIVHRDLKPDNVMLVAHPDGKDHVKVLDFGIAKVDDASGPSTEGRQLTRVGAVMGTAGYMAPEQAIGQAVDHRADLYSLGVLLYEMIAGHPPYVAEELSQIVAKQLTERPPPLPEGTPLEIASLVDRLLRTSPSERPDSAAEVATELARAREPRAVIAAPGDGGGVPTAPARTAGAGAPRDARSSSGIAVFVVVGATLLGALLAWRAASSSPAAVPLPEPAPSASVLAVPSAAAPREDDSAEPLVTAAAARKPSPATSGTSHTETSVTETKTKTPDGRTVTTKTTKKTTTVEQRSEQKTTHRHTGPGGIYIPPPSQWFK